MSLQSYLKKELIKKLPCQFEDQSSLPEVGRTCCLHKKSPSIEHLHPTTFYSSVTVIVDTDDADDESLKEKTNERQNDRRGGKPVRDGVGNELEMHYNNVVVFISSSSG